MPEGARNAPLLSLAERDITVFADTERRCLRIRDYNALRPVDRVNLQEDELHAQMAVIRQKR